MIPDDEPLHSPGHNSNTVSPEIAAEMLRDALTTKFAERRDQFVRSATNAVVRDRHTAGSAADVTRLAGRLLKEQLMPLYQEHREPIDQASQALRSTMREFWQPVADALSGLRSRTIAWQDAEDKRIAEQEEEQARELAKMRAAVAPEVAAPPEAEPVPVATAEPPRRAPVRGIYGGKVSQTPKRTYEVEDLSAVPAWIMETETVKAAIVKVCEAMGKHHKQIPGIKIGTATTTRMG